MTTLKQVKPEDVWYRFEDEVDIDYEVSNKTIVITGNRHFQDFGDEDLVKVINENYYDEDQKLFENPDGTCYEDVIGYDYDVYEELKKLTGKDWEQKTLRGYSQGDWQDIYYVKGAVSDDRIEEIENFYMGKVSEFHVTDDNDPDGYVAYIPDDVVWEGKDAICKYLDLKPEDTIIYDEDEKEID